MLSLRVPADWEAFDVMKRPAEAVARSDSLYETVAALARGIDAANAIALMGISHALCVEGKPDVRLFCVLTVALADVPGPFPDSIPGAAVDPVAFAQDGGDYRGVRIRRRRDAGLGVQYMLATEHGVLACTFMTAQGEAFERLMPLLDKVAGTCFLEAG